METAVASRVSAIITLFLAVYFQPANPVVAQPVGQPNEEFGTLWEFVDQSTPDESASLYQTTSPNALFQQDAAPRRLPSAPVATEISKPVDPLQTQHDTTTADPASAPDPLPPRHQPQTKLQIGKRIHTAPLDLRESSQEPWRVYRSKESSILWAATDDAGWTSLINAPYLPREKTSGLRASVSIHWLNGPGSVPLPPRLYDMLLFYQRRETLNEYLSYDIAASAGLYTDFEDSAREGLRFPAHAVGAFHVTPELDVVFGADFLDRDDFTALPVFGVSIQDTAIRGLRMELIFPRPRIEYAWNSETRSYLSGNLAGGTWDIEMPDSTGDVVTITEYKLAIGVETADEDGQVGFAEIGWLFNRTAEYRILPGSHELGNTLMLQSGTRY